MENNNGNDESGVGYYEFNDKQAKGIMYKLCPMSDPLKEKLTMYVQGGAMDQDLRYAREVYGLANTSGRKDFTAYWESPWIEEHIRDSSKMKRIESQQRAMAVRSYIKASSSQDPENVGKFLDTVDTLTKWEDKYDSKENVKTVSRLVQSYERVVLRSIMSVLEMPICSSYIGKIKQHFNRIENESYYSSSVGGNNITSITHSLRRADATFDLFASAVAQEISWADGTNGSKNLSIYMTRQLQEKKNEAIMALIRQLYSLSEVQLPVDLVGLPLMSVNYNLCVSRGVLVVGPGSTNATYILDIDGHIDADTGELDLSGIKTIKITDVFSEPNHSDAKPANKPRPATSNTEEDQSLSKRKRSNNNQGLVDLI
jgi:hypothetical protein